MSIKSKLIIALIFINLINIVGVLSDSEYCSIVDSTKDDVNCGKNKYVSNKRYILYDVNPSEGFNLRRDVYIRIAVFINYLTATDHKYQWHLILPPWGNLYHWRSRDVGRQIQIPWSTFFDVKSLEKFAPVMEMHDFVTEYKAKIELIIDKVYVLENDPNMFENGDFRNKNQVHDCGDRRIRYKKLENSDKYTGYFWGFNNITANDVKCVTFHGSASHLVNNLEPTLYRSFMFDHMEIPLHDQYGSVDFWRARRSMRYNSQLYAIADEFRANYLNSTDAKDNINRPDDWTNEKGHRNALGGPYLAVHLRRRDFLSGRAGTVPTIKSAAQQLTEKMKILDLTMIFVATDAEDREYEELTSYLSEYEIRRFVPTDLVKKTFKDGGVAIIDQIICSCARYFIGTHESTFTFRIQEDREILGFEKSTTFNRLCSETNKKCRPDSQWTIVW